MSTSRRTPTAANGSGLPPYLAFRVSPAQKRLIEKAAKQAGYRTIAEWLRQLALRAAEKATAA